MRDLSRFMINPFDDRNIATARLVAFTTDHLQRMKANDGGGGLSDRINATTSALGQVMDGLTDDQTQLGIRKARKMSKDTFRKSLPEKVAKIVAAVTAAYGPGSPEETECCPRGRSIFSTCQDDAVSSHLQVLIDGVTAHQAALGASPVSQATALKTAWLSVYNASETSTSAKANTEEGRRLARANLSRTLYLNLCKLMELFPFQPDKLKLYMQQNLLDLPAREKK